jgi:hypothetical protein
VTTQRRVETDVPTGGRRSARAQVVDPGRPSLPDLLSVTDVMERYRVRDRRTARRIMEDAGCFTIRGNAYVYADDLAAFERSNRHDTLQSGTPPSTPRPRGRRKPGPSAENGFGLTRHWWQQPTDAT